MKSRSEIHHEEYSKTVNIEALTTYDIALREIYPACVKYASAVADNISKLRSVSASVNTHSQEEILEKVNSLSNDLYSECRILDITIKEAQSLSGSLQSHYYRTDVLPRMEEVRRISDELELVVGREYWPFPTYSDILFYN